MKTALFLYDVAQVPLLSSLALQAGDLEIIAVGAEIEDVLAKEGIAYRSARGMRRVSTRERFELAKRLGSDILNKPQLDFFSHRDIHIGRLYTLDLQDHLARFFYCLDIVKTALDQNSYERVMCYKKNIVPSKNDRLLSSFHVNEYVDAVSLVCKQLRIPCTIIETNKQYSCHSFQKRFFLAPIITLGAIITNLLVSLIARRKKIRVLASEYWSHINSTFAQLPEAELYMLDRAEAWKSGFRTMLKHRMRTVHVEQFVGIKAKIISTSFGKKMRNHWSRLLEEDLIYKNIVYQNLELDGHIKKIVSHIINEGGVRAVKQIEGTFVLLQTVKPDVVLLRASTSAQIHFAVLALVAQKYAIRAVENQHGLFSFAPVALNSDHTAEYIAEYGPIVRKQLVEAGYQNRKLFDVGSPRFHQNERISNRVKSDQKRVVFIAPDAIPGFFTDQYDVIDYLQAVARVAKPLDSKVVIKLRPSTRYREFFLHAIDQAFRGQSYVVRENEQLSDVLASGDIVVSCFSTALMEALLSGKPTIFYAPFEIYQTFLEHDFSEHEKAGALKTARNEYELKQLLEQYISDEELCKHQGERALSFMAKQYSFDGHDAERLADVLRRLSRRSQTNANVGE